MSGIFNPSIFNNDIFNVGEEAVEEEIADAVVMPARPIDFVISPPYYMHEIQRYARHSLGFAAKQHGDDEQSEIVEMIQLYRIATHALAR